MNKNVLLAALMFSLFSQCFGMHGDIGTNLGILRHSLLGLKAKLRDLNDKLVELRGKVGANQSGVQLTLENRKKIIGEIWAETEAIRAPFDGETHFYEEIVKADKALDENTPLSVQQFQGKIDNFLKNYEHATGVEKLTPQQFQAAMSAAGVVAQAATVPEWKDVKTLVKADMSGDYADICKRHADNILIGDTNQYKMDGKSACPFIAALVAVGIVNDNPPLSKNFINKTIESGVKQFKQFIANKQGEVEHAAFDEASQKIWPELEKPFLDNPQMVTLNWNTLDGVPIRDVLNGYSVGIHHPWACVITKPPETTVLFQLKEKGDFYYFDSHGRSCNSFILSFSSIDKMVSFLKEYILPVDPDDRDNDVMSMDFITKK